ncbi:hypothetical protein CEP52_004259 [Fusarium oligoseptatum]|uniref:Uncharacterized protein n=1 Tax=Fusarium oligoseptatum TaxID=2604345 RepID=A0A428U4B8_9HYPO|nr:hypothetical protein CEP52_004259 [Fusarium oligoseptatum]
MSTTPATTPRPAATSTHKRKRNITAHSILEEMEARGYTPVSPETDALWNKCKSKARRVLNHPEADVDDLKDHWKTVSKLVCAKTDAKEAAEKHKAIEKKLKGKLQESKDQLHNFENLMQIGDWAAGLQNIVKGAESEVVHEFVEDLKRKRGKPIPTAQGKKAVTKARKGARPAVMVPDSPWTKGKWDDIE